MRNKIENYWHKIKVRVFNFFSIKKKDTKLKREIELLKSQVASLSEIVQEQSNIVVAIAKIQADLCKSISVIENYAPSDDYFLIKIPMKSEGVSN